MLCLELRAERTGARLAFGGKATLRTEVDGAPRDTEVGCLLRRMGKAPKVASWRVRLPRLSI